MGLIRKLHELADAFRWSREETKILTLDDMIEYARGQRIVSTGFKIIQNGWLTRSYIKYEFVLPSEVKKIDTFGLYDVCYEDKNVTSVDMGSVTDILGDYALYGAFKNCVWCENVNLSKLTNVSGNSAMYLAFQNCLGTTHLDLGKLETVRGYNAMGHAFEGWKNLVSVDFSSLESIAGQDPFAGCFQYCSLLLELSFPKLKTIHKAYGSLGTFSGNYKIQRWYFPKLETIGESRLFSVPSVPVELHFGAANEEAIKATEGYPTLWGMGAGKATVYFDL